MFGGVGSVRWVPFRTPSLVPLDVAIVCRVALPEKAAGRRS